jgi:pimeloyl-ACP methyl ester carboxylesterase
MIRGGRTRLRHAYAELGEVRLHFVEAGEGPLVVLLHGFPEFWYAWRHQLEPLARAGFRVVAPDLRGFNLSSKPAGLAAYRLERLISDVEELVRFLGARRAAIVGHDWGGAIAWATAMAHPRFVERLAVLNAPHPVRFERGLLSPRQLARSWYVFFFQLPWLPELAGRAFDYGWAREALRRAGFSEEEIGCYVESWSRPGAATASINYYRALLRRSPAGLRGLLRRSIDCPVLVIWGEQDRYLGSGLADPPRGWCGDVRVERIADAGHWVQCSRPERVNDLLLEFLAPVGSAGGPGAGLAGGDERRRDAVGPLAR